MASRDNLSEMDPDPFLPQFQFFGDKDDYWVLEVQWDMSNEGMGVGTPNSEEVLALLHSWLSPSFLGDGGFIPRHISKETNWPWGQIRRYRVILDLDGTMGVERVLETSRERELKAKEGTSKSYDGRQSQDKRVYRDWGFVYSGSLYSSKNEVVSGHIC